MRQRLRVRTDFRARTCVEVLGSVALLGAAFLALTLKARPPKRRYIMLHYIVIRC